MKLLVINGPNLNLLGLREPDIYGSRDYAALQRFIREVCDREGIQVDIFQSNHEGAIVDRIQQAYGEMDGIVINPAAYALRASASETGVPRKRSAAARACSTSMVSPPMQGIPSAEASVNSCVRAGL